MRRREGVCVRPRTAFEVGMRRRGPTCVGLGALASVALTPRGAGCSPASLGTRGRVLALVRAPLIRRTGTRT